MSTKNLVMSLLRNKNFIITILLVIGTAQKSFAQGIDKPLYYFSSEVNLGNYIGITMDLNYIVDQKYTFKLGVVANIRRPVNQPTDYTSGLIGILSFGLAQPVETMGSINAAVGKIYNLNSAKSLRLNTAVGIGFTQIQTVGNWQKDLNANFVENYTYDNVSKNVVSVIINPKLEIPLGGVFGFSVSPMAVLNSKSNYYGVGLGYIIGRVK